MHHTDIHDVSRRILGLGSDGLGLLFIAALQKQKSSHNPNNLNNQNKPVEPDSSSSLVQSLSNNSGGDMSILQPVPNHWLTLTPQEIAQRDEEHSMRAHTEAETDTIMRMVSGGPLELLKLFFKEYGDETGSHIIKLTKQKHNDKEPKNEESENSYDITTEELESVFWLEDPFRPGQLRVFRVIKASRVCIKCYG